MLMKESKDLDAILKEKQVPGDKVAGKLIVDTYFSSDEIVYIYSDGTYSKMVAQSDCETSWFDSERFYESDIISVKYDGEPYKYKYELTTIGKKLLDYKVIKKSTVDEYIKKVKERTNKQMVEGANSRLQRGIQEVIGSYKTIVENTVGLQETSKELLNQLKETISEHVYITL